MRAGCEVDDAHAPLPYLCGALKQRLKFGRQRKVSEVIHLKGALDAIARLTNRKLRGDASVEYEHVEPINLLLQLSGGLGDALEIAEVELYCAWTRTAKLVDGRRRGIALM